MNGVSLVNFPPPLPALFLSCTGLSYDLILNDWWHNNCGRETMDSDNLGGASGRSSPPPTIPLRSTFNKKCCPTMQIILAKSTGGCPCIIHFFIFLEFMEQTTVLRSGVSFILRSSNDTPTKVLIMFYVLLALLRLCNMWSLFHFIIGNIYANYFYSVSRR